MTNWKKKWTKIELLNLNEMNHVWFSNQISDQRKMVWLINILLIGDQCQTWKENGFCIIAVLSFKEGVAASQVNMVHIQYSPQTLKPV